ncbi:MAG: hypothetical protein H8Z69_03465 [Nanohaloarchaea archaeon]|nr:hypothetical protein [Candidatus Nanohaloarchaea archaeon]
MYIAASHTIAFIVLSVAAVFDLKTTEVPDTVSIVGVLAGLGLHLTASIPHMDFAVLTNLATLLSDPLIWFQALGDPLLWSIGAGAAFSVYGWGLYFLGMWGGADAFAMSVIGFGTPYAISGTGISFGISIFLNILFLGMIYSLGYAFYISTGNNALSKTWKTVRTQEKRISMEIMFAGLLSAFMSVTGFYVSLLYFGILLGLIFLYRYLKVIQDDLMTKKIPVSDLEPGDVLDDTEEQGGKVKGITEEQINSIDKDKVRIKTGVRFIPVFPAALLLTELGIGGLSVIAFILSL